MAKKIKELAEGAGKAATDLFNKAQETVTKAVDVNGDGKLDFEDVKKAADSVGNAAHKAVADVKGGIGEGKKRIEEKIKASKLEADRKSLRPIFKEDINSTEFSLPKLIMIANEPDKVHKESEVCNGSVGFNNKADKMDIVTIYKDDLDVLGVSFYPDVDSEAYYVNPVDRDNYISLKKYTEYLIIQRMNEMQRIAQCLGAKKFDVRIVTTDSSKEKESRSVQLKAARVNAEAKENKTVQRSKIFDYTANSTFLGQEPAEPRLRYLAKDPVIQNLIEMRLHGNMTSQTVKVQLSDTAGIKVEDAVKIGAALKAIKSTAGGQFVKDTETQSNSYFEYTIEF